MLLSNTLTMNGSDVANLVDFRPVVWKSNVTDRGTHGRTHRKMMLLSHTLSMRGSDETSLVEFRPVV